MDSFCSSDNQGVTQCVSGSSALSSSGTESFRAASSATPGVTPARQKPPDLTAAITDVDVVSNSLGYAELSAKWEKTKNKKKKAQEEHQKLQKQLREAKDRRVKRSIDDALQRCRAEIDAHEAVLKEIQAAQKALNSKPVAADSATEESHRLTSPPPVDVPTAASILHELTSDAKDCEMPRQNKKPPRSAGRSFLSSAADGLRSVAGMATRESDADEAPDPEEKEDEKDTKIGEWQDMIDNIAGSKSIKPFLPGWVLWTYGLFAVCILLWALYKWATWEPGWTDIPYRLVRTIIFGFRRLFTAQGFTWGDLYNEYYRSPYDGWYILRTIIEQASVLGLLKLCSTIGIGNFIVPQKSTTGPANNWSPVDRRPNYDALPSWSCFKYTGQNRPASEMPYGLKATSVAVPVTLYLGVPTVCGVPVVPGFLLNFFGGRLINTWIDLETLSAVGSKVYSGTSAEINVQATRVVNNIFPQVAHGHNLTQRVHMAQATALVSSILVGLAHKDTAVFQSLNA